MTTVLLSVAVVVLLTPTAAVLALLLFGKDFR